MKSRTVYSVHGKSDERTTSSPATLKAPTLSSDENAKSVERSPCESGGEMTERSPQTRGRDVIQRDPSGVAEASDAFVNNSSVLVRCHQRNLFSLPKNRKLCAGLGEKNEKFGQINSTSGSASDGEYILQEDSEGLKVSRSCNHSLLFESSSRSDLRDEFLNFDESLDDSREQGEENEMGEPSCKWRFKFVTSPVQKSTVRQVSSKLAGEGITKLKFERWHNMRNDAGVAKPFIRYTIPPTFPSIFSHFKVILTCLFLYLFLVGPFVRLPTSFSTELCEENDYISENNRPRSPLRSSGETPTRCPPAPRGGVLLAEAYSSTYNAKDFSRNVTQLLDSLLANYDKRIRPGFGEGPPTLILVNMNVRSMGPFSEKLEEYGMQLYMRQVWYDSRLKFNKTDLGREEFSMNWMFAAKIWKPDTFFINGKKSYAHAITAPNMFVRLQHDGQIYMSMRLTVRASCVMHLRKFPLDTQTCPLRLSSYGYDAKNVTYMWDPEKLVTVDSDVSLAQYELFKISTFEAVVPVRRIEEISTLTVKFHLMRLTGFFLLQVYVPCILIVCSSWVGFWITKKDAPGRVCLGVTTVLAMVTLGFGGRSSFPEVAYATALDYFVVLCMVFLFGAVIEYACINFLERRANKRRKKMEDLKKKIVEQLTTEGAGCIKVIPSVHTSLLESFKVHLTAFPAATAAVNTDKPKPDPKAKLFQALKLPLTMVPKAADEAKQKMPLPMKTEIPPEHASQEQLSASKSGSESSLAPKQHTPRLLQRLHVLQRRLSAHDVDETASQTSSPQPSPHPSLQALPLVGRLLPTPPIPESTAEGPQGSPQTPTTSSIVDQATPTMSPQISPLTSATSSPGSPTITTTPPPPNGDPGKPPLPGAGGDGTGAPGSPPPTPGAGGGGADGKGGEKQAGTVIKMEPEEPPPPPPVKHTITVWQLLVRKRMLMKKMTPHFELPTEEDLLDRFSVIDLYSRRIFPSLFFILFTIYWVLFNYYITDEFPGEKREMTDGLVN